MRILNFSTSDIGGGAARAAYRILRFQNRLADARGVMVCSQKLSDDKDVVQIPKVESLRQQLQSGLMQGLMKRFLGQEEYMSAGLLGSTSLKGYRNSVEGFDVVNLHWVNGEFLSINQIRSMEKPLIWTLHDCWPVRGITHYPPLCDEAKGWKKKMKNIVEQLAIARKKRYYPRHMVYHVTTDWMRDICIMSGLATTSDIVKIEYPIDIESIKGIDKGVAREILSICDDTTVVVYGAVGGSADKRKGWDLLLSALKNLANQEKVLLLTFGGTEGVERVGDLTVRSMGKLFDDYSLRIAYSCGDICVVPSRIEAFGQDGSYLAEYLADQGYVVYGTLRHESYGSTRIAELKEKLSHRLVIYVNSLSDPLSVYELLSNIRPAEIYHLAAHSHVTTSSGSYLDIMTSNLGLTVNLVSAITLLDLP